MAKKFWIISKDSTNTWDGHSRRDASNTDRTGSGSSLASTTWAIRSAYEFFKDTPVEQNWAHSCKVTWRFHLNGPIFVSCYYRSSIVEGRLIAGGISYQKGKTSLLLTGCRSNERPDVDPTFRKKKNEPRLISYTMIWRSVQNAIYWFDL